MRQVQGSWIGWLVGVFFCIAMAPQASASWEEARSVVEQTTEQMVALLADDSLREDTEFARLYEGVELVLDPVVDFDRIARGVMAKYYRQASAEQRSRFSVAFRDSLIRTYAKALSTFRVGRFEMLDNNRSSNKPNKQTVWVNAYDAQGTKYAVIYYLSNRQGGWKLTNVVLDGVNLGVTFRNQFANMVQENGGDLDRVIAQWSQNSEQPEREA